MLIKKTGFTLTELLTVIAIIGILTTIAIPLYKGYTTMAKLVEIENTMWIISNSVTSYYQDNNSWPNCPSGETIRDVLGVSLEAVTRISSISISGTDGTISALIGDIDDRLRGKELKLIPNPNNDGSIVWKWGWSTDFPIQFRPKDGR